MRSTVFLGKLLVACLAAVAIVAGCKTTTAGGTASGGMSEDGGMPGAAGGAMSGMADAGASMAHDMGQGASTAASDAKAGAQSAGQAMADAGTQAYGAARDTASGAAAGASGAATTAADAARSTAGSMSDGGMAPSAGGAGTSAGGASITDPQIAAIAVAANNVDIAAAKLAKKTTKNAKVKSFANDMIRDHTSANKQATALVKALGVAPEESDTSRSLKQGGDDNLAKLKSLKGKEFDSAYAEHEVAYHQQVLDALDNTLIPGAQNADLKSLLESVRGVVAQHLDHAKMMVDSLSK